MTNTAQNESAERRMSGGTMVPAGAHWLQPEEEVAWDAFVAQHPMGLIYHRSSWKRVLEQAFPHIRGRFLALRDGSTGKIQAGLPVYTVKSWLLGNRVVSVPFASFCDPLVSSVAEFEQLLPSIKELYRQISSRRLEVRTMKTATQFAGSSLVPTSAYKHHVLLLDKNPQALFNSFAKSSICQKITKASKSGITVVEAEEQRSVETCHRILSQTRRRLSLPPMPLAFFVAMQSVLWPERMKMFLALQQGKPVGCHLVLISDNLWISEYSGNTDEALHGTNQLLYWETIQRAHAAGADAFSFGRTARSNEGLLAYKRRWRTIEGDLVDFALPSESAVSASKRVQDHRKDSAPYRFLRSFLSNAPAPLGQMIGDFCYRHLG